MRILDELREMKLRDFPDTIPALFVLLGWGLILSALVMIGALALRFAWDVLAGSY